MGMRITNNVKDMPEYDIRYVEVSPAGQANLSTLGLGIFVPFIIAAALKTAQGSSTVAIITTAALGAPIIAMVAGSVTVFALPKFREAQVKSAETGARVIRSAVQDWQRVNNETTCPTLSSPRCTPATRK